MNPEIINTAAIKMNAKSPLTYKNSDNILNFIIGIEQAIPYQIVCG